jgi:DNA-directed RNA polymerase specialized sigma24 family protein
MQSMIALNIRSRSVTTEVLDAMTSASKNFGTDLLVSQVYAEHVYDLFNYGMNACDNQALVKNCIVELFLFVGGRPNLVQERESGNTNVFKMFRRLLIQQMASRGERSCSDIHKSLFSAENQMTQGLTSLQREALFLKFQRRLTYREVASIMDLTIEQLRGQISKAVDILLYNK